MGQTGIITYVQYRVVFGEALHVHRRKMKKANENERARML